MIFHSWGGGGERGEVLSGGGVNDLSFLEGGGRCSPGGGWVNDLSFRGSVGGCCLWGGGGLGGGGS